MSGWEDRLEREGGRFDAHPTRTGLRWVAWLVGIVVVIAVIGGIGNFVLGWFDQAAKTAGPANVTAQYHAVIEDWNAMQAAAGNYCSAKNSKLGPNSPALVEDPAFAYAAQYRHITVDYNERQNNIFEAGVVGPGGYPKIAPSLNETAQKVC